MTSEPEKESNTSPLATAVTRRFIARGKAYGNYQPGEMVEEVVAADNTTIEVRHTPCVYSIATHLYLFPQGSESAESLALALSDLDENDGDGGGNNPPLFTQQDYGGEAIQHSHEDRLAEDNTVKPPKPDAVDNPQTSSQQTRAHSRPRSGGR